MSEWEFGMPGVVTTKEWTCDQFGLNRRAFFADRWEIKTDAQMPIENFKSSERWSVAGYRYDPHTDQMELVALFPGCQILGFVKAEEVPFSADVANLSSQKRV